MITNDSRILVLCTGNSCRSQMAEGFFRHYLAGLGLEKAAAAVRSAGLETHGLNPRVVQVMKETGIDISGQTSNNLREYLTEQFDYIITVCDNAAKNCPSFPGPGLRLHWPFDDPAVATGNAEMILNEFRRVRDQIDTKIRNWLGIDG